jgi:hypothetical protein
MKKAVVLIAVLIFCASQTVLENKAVAQTNNLCVQVQAVGNITILSVHIEPGPVAVIRYQQGNSSVTKSIRVGTATMESHLGRDKLIYRWYSC